MAITVNLVSEKKNMINNFLSAFFEKDMLTDENTLEWSYTLTDSLSSIELVSAITDNYNENDITCWISLDTNVFVKVKEDNGNDIIKYILHRFSKIS